MASLRSILRRRTPVLEGTRPIWRGSGFGRRWLGLLVIREGRASRRLGASQVIGARDRPRSVIPPRLAAASATNNRFANKLQMAHVLRWCLVSVDCLNRSVDCFEAGVKRDRFR